MTKKVTKILKLALSVLDPITKTGKTDKGPLGTGHGCQNCQMTTEGVPKTGYSGFIMIYQGFTGFLLKSRYTPS